MSSVSIIVPTFNEAQNIPALHAGLAQVLKDRQWELIFVDDDSPDGTSDAARALARVHANVRCLQRVQDRGLCSAVHWGVQAAHGDHVVVMDGDLQHDPAIIPAMLAELEAGTDIVAGSRFLPGSTCDGLSSPARNALSIHGNRLVNFFLRRRLSDPLTGYFATSRRLFLRSIPRMQADGFKVFFDLVYHNRKARIRELAFDFRPRRHGESKLEPHVFWSLLCDMISKLSGSLLPPRLVSFVGVGVIGSTLHFSVLYAVLGLGTAFWFAQTLATVAAMVFNFTLNNILTYSAERLRNGAFFRGLFLYSVIASFGIVANVSTAQLTYDHFQGQTFIASTIGIVIDVVWRFVVSNRLVWRRANPLASAA